MDSDADALHFEIVIPRVGSSNADTDTLLN